MAFKIRDFECPTCGKLHRDVLCRDGAKTTCAECGAAMPALPSAVSGVKIRGVQCSASQAKQTLYKDID